MAGQLTIDTLKASTGVLATQNGMTGIAKAWVLFNGTAGTLTTSFNVSSITKSATGNYTITYTTSMPSSSYSVVGAGGDTGGGSVATICTVTLATGTASINVLNSSAALADRNQISLAVFSA